MAHLAALEQWFRSVSRALLGYSGGVDSSVLAIVGSRTLGPDRFLAVLGMSPSVPAGQWQAAQQLVEAHGVPFLAVDTNELDDPSYRANAPDRCYFCKRELWTRLAAIAERRGFATIIDGTHRDDLGEHRPGASAAAERRIRSPFVELGLRKAEIREAARSLGLAVADAPAAPCLASRIRYGLEVTGDRLRQVDQAEAFLRSLGISGDLRVRHLGTTARIEVNPDMFELLDGRWGEVVPALGGLGFSSVERDPRGYRRGSLLPVAS
ncbi:MAG: ATP-dependent sacrificial sulfur transferase LarE [Gemmatimonadetes bacterium]|nr:ATP-dependent sacrificial sulfur transferase LarE [Gemmatimonadota bacterium]